MIQVELMEGRNDSNLYPKRVQYRTVDFRTIARVNIVRHKN